jgi:hypothetical protein
MPLRQDARYNALIRQEVEQMRLEDCVTSAYDQIKDRKGSMNNGTFVKQETPKKPWGHQSVTL